MMRFASQLQTNGIGYGLLVHMQRSEDLSTDLPRRKRRRIRDNSTERIYFRFSIFIRCFLNESNGLLTLLHQRIIDCTSPLTHLIPSKIFLYPFFPSEN